MTMPSRSARRSAGVLRWVTLMALIGAPLLTGAATARAGAAEGTIGQHVAVPSYINPSADPDAWVRLIGSTPGSVGLGVANVINGPDYIPLTDWSSVIAGAHAAGIRMVGYVDTGYLGTTGQLTRLGSSAMADWFAQIEHDIDTWYTFYGPDLGGIFFDQGQNACGPTPDSTEWADRYQQLTDYVKRLHPGAVTVVNPGIVVPECYRNSADIIVTFEGSYESYIGKADNPVLNFQPTDWDPGDPNKIWHIIYGASTPAQAAEILALSRTRGAGYVYVTDDVMANPYDTLPNAEYWNVETQAVLATNGGASAAAVGSTLTSTTNKGPSRPRDFDTDEVWADRIQFSWTAPWVRPGSNNIVAYDLYRNGVLMASVPSTQLTYLATGLTPRTSYSFAIAARDGSGNVSPLTTALRVRTDIPDSDPPTAPGGFAVSGVEYTSAHVSWSPPTGSPSPIAAYEVLQNGKVVAWLPASMTAVTIGGLAPGQTYQLAVQAIDSSGARSAATVALPVTTAVLPDGQLITEPAAASSPGGVTYGANFLVPFAFRRVFIATGNAANPCWATGSTPQMCADYVLENGRLLKYSGAGGDWKWDYVKDATTAVTGYTYQWTIAPEDIGNPTAPAFVVNANGYAPNTYCGAGVACTSTGPPLPYEN